MPRTDIEVLLSVDHDDDVTEELLKKGAIDELEGLTIVDFRAGAVNHGTAVIDEIVVNKIERASS